MKFVYSPLAFVLAALCAAAPVEAASLFWSFESNPDGSGAASSLVTYNEGFLGAPTFTLFNGTGGSTSSVGGGGASSYTYPGNGVTYEGSGSGAAGGHSLLWGTTNSLNYFAGAGFTLSLNTVGLTDLGLRFDVRAATGSTSSGRPPDSFSAIDYSLDGGTSWFSTGVLSPTWANGNATPFSAQTLNLSGVDAIEGQSNLRLRFTFETSAVPSAAVTQNVRIDNLVISAVPEPSSAALLCLGSVGLLAWRRRPARLG
jgi:hypothetical protein